jgi:hypothetical protein
LLREHGFDDFVEAQCASFYPETMGRPGVPPGIYFPALADWLGTYDRQIVRSAVPIRSVCRFLATRMRGA